MKFVKVNTERGYEVWPNATGAPLIAVFAKDIDADHFIASQHYPNFQRIALKVAEAYPSLNLSDSPLNPSGELALNIARIIKQNWLAHLPQPEQEGEV